ncbi:GNAT family N-acetyltransferase [Chthonobacter rhizosphaerae]|uniref:GNAT family N-acetyltransferase n=1 Tax=Chthonobacter rhizosphaerae TaxID=2735553 RepID=UPI0015EFB08B|nr:GNAT family N-acetyltransferase [Chthonobacter rhizosphaerae]
MSAVSIRPAVPADRPALEELLREIYAYFGSLEDGALPEPALIAASTQDMSAMAALSFGPNRFCDCLVATDDTGPVGYLAHHPGVFEGRGALFVAGLFVRRAVRGAGIGSALMAETEAIARARGAATLVWTVWHRNAAAIGFYHRLGARLYVDDLVMWKTVDQTPPALAAPG